MNIFKWLKNIKINLIIYSFSFSNADIRKPLGNISGETLFSKYLTEGPDGITKMVIDFFFDENGNLTEDGVDLKETIDNVLRKEYGNKNPDYKDITIKELMQAAVIGFSDGMIKPSKEKEIGGSKVYYEEYITDESQPLIVWFHGNGCSYDQWNWNNPDAGRYLKNVLAFEYPSYVNNSYSTFEEIDKYTTCIADFLKDYINNKYPKVSNKNVVIYSHSFGCNVNTLVYVKLKNLLGSNIVLKSVLIFPYYSAIDASASVLQGKLIKNKKIETNSSLDIFSGIFPGELTKQIPIDKLIKSFVLQMYMRMFQKSNMTDVPHDAPNNCNPNKPSEEFLYIDSISNNGTILSDAQISYVDINLKHCRFPHGEWTLDMNLNNGKTLIDYLLDPNNFNEEDGQKKSILIIYSDIDEVVSNGGLLIAYHILDKNHGHRISKSNDYDTINKYFEIMNHKLSKKEFNSLTDEVANLKHFSLGDLENLKKLSACRCSDNLKDADKTIGNVTGYNNENEPLGA